MECDTKTFKVMKNLAEFVQTRQKGPKFDRVILVLTLDPDGDGILPMRYKELAYPLPYPYHLEICNL